ncbi:hypothetical protein OO014_05940 [Intrasporangium calvum]|uniref:Uncharacterized protein n=1 Tax=Intrasporangium calvum TaxID=53358 RepID=A0ABT5GEW0_9MICO|nr:hypothetical protein [Intrasporangium calvum]MDC5696792.1 hypothetical protein [Intrasporangium calvum]
MTGMTGSGRHAAAPGAAGDAATLRTLDRGRRVTADLADQLLTHLPDVGDITTQRALDSWVEQAADTLRALSEALEERLIEVGSSSGGPVTVSAPAAAGRPVATDGSSRAVRAAGRDRA